MEVHFPEQIWETVQVITQNEVNARSQFMAHHQFMAQFCDCPIKCVYDYFFQFYLLLFDEILNLRFMAQFQ